MLHQDCAECPMIPHEESSAAELTLGITQRILRLVATRDNVLERLRQIEDYVRYHRADYDEEEAKQ